MYSLPTVVDCNENGTADACDIQGGGSFDADGNGIPDECDQMAAIPAVSEWGLAILTLLVLTVGTVVMRTRVRTEKVL